MCVLVLSEVIYNSWVLLIRVCFFFFFLICIYSPPTHPPSKNTLRVLIIEKKSIEEKMELAGGGGGGVLFSARNLQDWRWVTPISPTPVSPLICPILPISYFFR